MRFFLCVAAVWILTTGAQADALKLPMLSCDTKVSCARDSVVSVLPLWPLTQTRSEEPEGSGVVVSEDGLIATANHVIGPATKVLVRTVSGEVIEAEIVLRDAPTDIALLRVSQSLKPISMARQVSVGEQACAIGNSFGLDLSVTCGVVSATEVTGAGFNRIEDFVQTDAAVNPGMSGGALVNANGELVGMLSAIFTKQSDSNIGVNFAVSSILLGRMILDHSDDGEINRVSSGLLVKPALKNGEAGLAGARVVRVKEGSAEARAGISLDDVILFAGNRRIKRAGAYRAALALLHKGGSLKLKILRKEKPKTIVIKFD